MPRPEPREQRTGDQAGVGQPVQDGAGIARPPPRSPSSRVMKQAASTNCSPAPEHGCGEAEEHRRHRRQHPHRYTRRLACGQAVGMARPAPAGAYPSREREAHPRTRHSANQEARYGAGVTGRAPSRPRARPARPLPPSTAAATTPSTVKSQSNTLMQSARVTGGQSPPLTGVGTGSAVGARFIVPKPLSFPRQRESTSPPPQRGGHRGAPLTPWPLPAPAAIQPPLSLWKRGRGAGAIYSAPTLCALWLNPRTATPRAPGSRHRARHGGAP